MRRRPSPALVVAFLALLVSLGGVSFAAIPARDGDIHACYSKKTGAIEVVDTQRDRFSCERNWNGLTIDTTPTRLLPPGVRFNPRTTQSTVEATDDGPRLTSPNGKFRIEVQNNGIRLVGPNALVTLGENAIDVTGGVAVNVSGGASVNVLGGNTVNLGAGQDLTLDANRDLLLNGDRNATLSATDDARVRARRVFTEGFISTRMETNVFDLVASGSADLRSSGVFSIRGSDVRIEDGVPGN